MDFFGNITEFFSGLGSVAGDVWQDIQDALITAFDSIYEFNETLVNQNDVMQDMIDQITAGGAYDGVSLLTYIGAYRYLVGDILFNYTYLLLIVGAGFMIYKLIIAIYNYLKNVLLGVIKGLRG